MRHKVAITAVSLVIAGGVFGLVGARYIFVNSALSLIPWGIASLLIGALAPTRATAMAAAAQFGFALTTAFMFFSYDGADPIAGKIIAFCVIGLVGAGCALVAGLVGWALRQRIRP